MEDERNSCAQAGDKATMGAQLCPRANRISSRPCLRVVEQAATQLQAKADGVDDHQIRTKATHRANSKKIEGIALYGPAVVH